MTSESALSAESLGQALNSALTLTESTDGVLRAPYFTQQRGVVFGGQMVGQAVVAAARRMTGKRVRTVQTIFAKGASVAEPVDIHVETMREGRNIGSVTVTFTQHGQLCARSLVLLDTPEPDLVRHQIDMPDVAPPDAARAQPHWMAAPETIVVDDVDINDPHLTGPATLQLWVRFPDAPSGDGAMARALLSHATDGWLIGTAMRPHPRLGQSMAHREVSTGVIAHDVTFHEEFDASDWLLIDLSAQAAGGGHTYGRGHVFTAKGTLVASFVQQALLRRFPQGQDPIGNESTVF
jgi:acyl-CoA thioesterase II